MALDLRMTREWAIAQAAQLYAARAGYSLTPGTLNEAFLLAHRRSEDDTSVHTQASQVLDQGLPRTVRDTTAIASRVIDAHPWRSEDGYGCDECQLPRTNRVHAR